MAKISVDRHVILPAGMPAEGMSIMPGEDGAVHLAVWGSGVRALVQLAPAESIQTGVGFITNGGEVARREAERRPESASPLIIVNGANGAG